MGTCLDDHNIRSVITRSRLSAARGDRLSVVDTRHGKITRLPRHTATQEPFILNHSTAVLCAVVLHVLALHLYVDIPIEIPEPRAASRPLDGSEIRISRLHLKALDLGRSGVLVQHIFKL